MAIERLPDEYIRTDLIDGTHEVYKRSDTNE